MIKDSIKQAQTYFSLGCDIKKALLYLQQNNLSNTQNGKYEIEQDKIFAIVQDYQTKQKETAKLEAHKKYIDIQFIIKGKEQLGCTHIDNTSISIPYDEEKDIMFLDGNCDFLTAEQGDFLIFFPHDAHMPSLAIDKPSYVKKVVIKIKI